MHISLAGSERYEDSKAHDKIRMDESKENNKSLMNLKECVQAKAKTAQEDGFVHIPWRSNKLTMLLKVVPLITFGLPCSCQLTLPKFVLTADFRHRIPSAVENSDHRTRVSPYPGHSPQHKYTIICILLQNSASKVKGTSAI